LDIVWLYLSEKYTAEKLIFNNPGKEVVDAINKLNTEMIRLLQPWGSMVLQDRKLN